MKAADPTIRIGVVLPIGEDSFANENTATSASPHAVVNSRTGATHYGWGPVLLSTLKALGVTPDFVTYHRYEQAPGQESDEALLMAPENGVPGQTSQGWAADAAELRQELVDYLGTSASSVEILVGENNSVYTNPGKQSVSMVNALYMADSMGSLLQTEFNAYTWWCLHGGQDTGQNNATGLYGWREYGDYGVTDPDDSPYPTYYAMKLLGDFARPGDSVVSVAADPANTLLSAYAVTRSDGTLNVLLINKDPSNATSATVAINGYGFTPAAMGTLWSYGVAQDNAAEAAPRTAGVDVAASPLPVAGATLSISLPAYSMAVASLYPPIPQITVQPSATATTVTAGGSTTLSAAAAGSAVHYQWQLNGATIPGATSASLVLSHIQLTQAGSYTVVVSNGGGYVTSSPVTLSVQSFAWLSNLSARGYVNSTGNNGAAVLIAGFVTTGPGTKAILLRGAGPRLGEAPFDIAGALADPELGFFNSTGEIGGAFGWDQSLTATFRMLGAFAFDPGSMDTALYLNFVTSGAYSEQISSISGADGVALVEIYDADPPVAATPANRLKNLSARAYVGQGADQLIGGFVIAGSSTETILVRGVGPALASLFQLTGILGAPVLTVYDSNGNVIASNSGWSSPPASGDSSLQTVVQPATAAAMATAGAFALDAGSADSAMILTLPPGNYTAVLGGADGGTGIGLIEIYEIQ